MSGFDGFGNFTRAMNWVADKNAAIKITAVRHDTEDDNFAAAFNQVLLRNGVAALTGDLKLGGNGVKGVGAGVVGTPSFSNSGDVTTGIYFPAAGVIGIVAAGVERARANNTGFHIPSGQLHGVGTNTPRTQLDVVGFTSLRGIYEDTVYSTTALTGTVQVDLLTAGVVIYDANAVGNFTFNARGDGSNSLNSLIAIGQSITFAIEVPQGGTAYYCTAITVDGSAPAQVKWFNGGAPTAGHINSIDTYAITIYKKANATFYVRAAQSQVK